MLLGVRFLQSRHDAALQEAERMLDSVVTLIEERSSRVLSTSGLFTSWLAISAQERGLDALAASAGQSMWLRSAARGLHAEEIMIIDPAGRIVATSGGMAEAANWPVAEEAFFAPLAQGERFRAGDFPALLKSPKTLISIASRIEGIDGRFGGIAMALVDVAELTRPVRARLSSQGVTMTIHAMDGAVLHSRSIGPTEYAFYPQPDQVAEMIARGGPTSLRTHSVRGEHMLLAWQQVEFLPLAISVGISLEKVLTQWRVESYRAAGLGLAALAVVAFATFGLLRGLKREERNQRALALSHSSVIERSRALQKANSMLAAANQEVMRAQSAKSRFLAAASHDLRQPLQATRLFLEVLHARAQDKPIQDITRRAMEALDGTNSLLNILLDVSTLEAGIVQPKFETFPVSQLLCQTRRESCPEAQIKGLQLRVAPCSAHIRSDPVLLQRILRNLVVNAIRYTQSGGIVVGCRRRGQALRIEVWDSGPGIPADRLKQIFEDFYQIGNPERDRQKGLGLGLSIVERMANLLGHQVDVRSTPGRGSVFSVTLPIVENPCEDELAPAAIAE